jgi:hypothetical protein
MSASKPQTGRQHDFSSPDGVLRFVQSVDYPYFLSAIFPSEMAYFIYACEQTGINCVIESGRDKGYSTAVLAAWGGLRGVHIVSIDIEMDARVAQECRQRLAGYSNLTLIAGDSFRKLPDILKNEPGKIALLIDGPKLHEAIYLSSTAAAFADVHLVAHHNIPYGDAHDDCLAHFLFRFPGGKRLEESEVVMCSAFPAFREWERELTHDTHRELERTTLLLSVLKQPGPHPGYLTGLTASQTFRSRLTLWWWNAGAFDLWFLKFPKWCYSVIRARLPRL